ALVRKGMKFKGRQALRAIGRLERAGAANYPFDELIAGGEDRRQQCENSRAEAPRMSPDHNRNHHHEREGEKTRGLENLTKRLVVDQKSFRATLTNEQREPRIQRRCRRDSA